jgi:hypothetical protein
LYYALGDLLAVRGDKHLAYRAYRRALDFGHARPDQVREAMDDVQELVKDKSGFGDDRIAAERAAAEVWVAAYQRFEDELVRTGKDLTDEASYASFYAAHGPAVRNPRFDATDDVRFIRLMRIIAFAGGGGVAALVVLAAARRYWLRSYVSQP